MKSKFYLQAGNLMFFLCALMISSGGNLMFLLGALMISSGLILHICVFAIVVQKPEKPVKLLYLSKKVVNEKMSIIRQSLSIGSTHNMGT